MRLVEQGRASLDDPVLKHLPKFKLKDRAATRALTLGHLVTHTGGWDGDIDNDTGWGDDALTRYVDDLRSQPQLVPVGAHFSYNNAGFVVAGRVIEVLTGKVYEAAIAELVFQPLGMADSFFSPIDIMSRRFAIGHHSLGKTAQVAHMLGISRSLAPAGGIASTVRDQLKYARFHLGDGRNAEGKRVLKASTMRLMQRDHFSAIGLAGTVGISWLIGEVGGVRTVAHGGNVSNLQVSSFLMVPSHDFAVTVLTNSGAGRQLHDEVEKWALKSYLGLTPTPPKVLEPGSVDLAQYSGEYASKLSIIDVKSVNGNLSLTPRWNLREQDFTGDERELVRKLMAEKPKPLKLRLTAADRAVVVDGPGAGTQGEFVREAAGGAIRWLRWGGRLNTRA